MPGQPAHPAAEGESADAGMRDIAGGGREAVLLGCGVKRSEQRTALYPRTPSLGVDPHCAERGQVDHQPAIRHPEPEHAVPAAPDTDLETLLNRGAHRGLHVPHARAADDELGATVHHGIPGPAGVVVAGITGSQHLTIQLHQRTTV